MIDAWLRSRYRPPSRVWWTRKDLPTLVRYIEEVHASLIDLSDAPPPVPSPESLLSILRSALMTAPTAAAGERSYIGGLVRLLDMLGLGGVGIIADLLDTHERVRAAPVSDPMGHIRYREERWARSPARLRGHRRALHIEIAERDRLIESVDFIPDAASVRDVVRIVCGLHAMPDGPVIVDAKAYGRGAWLTIYYGVPSSTMPPGHPPMLAAEPRVTLVSLDVTSASHRFSDCVVEGLCIGVRSSAARAASEDDLFDLVDIDSFPGLFGGSAVTLLAASREYAGPTRRGLLSVVGGADLRDDAPSTPPTSAAESRVTPLPTRPSTPTRIGGATKQRSGLMSFLDRQAPPSTLAVEIEKIKRILATHALPPSVPDLRAVYGTVVGRWFSRLGIGHPGGVDAPFGGRSATCPPSDDTAA